MAAVAPPTGSMTFSGEPFVQPSPELMVKVGRWWDENAPELWTHPGYSLERLHHLPTPDRPKQSTARLNVLYWPTGAGRWGTFHGLVTGSTLQTLWSELGTDSPTFANFQMFDGEVVVTARGVARDSRVVETQMRLLAARPVFVGSILTARTQVSGTNLLINSVAANVVTPDGYAPQDTDVGRTVTITGPDPPFNAGTYTITSVSNGQWVLNTNVGTLGSSGGVWSSSLTQQTPDYSRRLYQVTLVDPRYYWWTKTLDYDFDPGDSWTTLLTNLVEAASGLTPTVPMIPAVYGSPNPARWTVRGRPLPVLIDAAAASVGLRFVYLRDGTCKFVTAGEATQASASQTNQWAKDTVLGGYGSVQSVSGNVPASVDVVFWGDVPTVVNKTLASLNAVVPPVLPGYRTATGVAGTKAFVGVDQRAGTATPVPADLATQVATDFYGWALSLADGTFRGIAEVESTGLEDRIEWEYVPGLLARVDDGQAKNPVDPLLPIERVVTRVVPTDWHDRNLYGDRPPPGYTYAVTLLADDGATDLWKATIQVVVGGTQVNGPQLGWGEDEYVLAVRGLAEVGDYGTAVPDPLVPQRWLFVPSQEPGEVRCNDCSWLADLASPCLIYEQLGGGTGRCSCMPTSVEVPMVKNTLPGGGEAWVGIRMGTSCCGCGGLIFRATNDDEDYDATLEMYRYHEACTNDSGGTGGVFTKNLKLECCGIDSLGRRFVVFSGWGDEPCGGTPEGCDNAFRIRITCGDCPEPSCTCDKCGECCEGSTPLGWMGDFFSFSNAAKNGFWTWLPDPDENCVWTASCYDTDSVLDTYTDGDGYVVWRLTHGDSVYEQADAEWHCCDGVVLIKISGDGPANITIYPIKIDGECVPCEPVWPETLTFTVTEASATGGATVGWTVGQVVTLSKLTPVFPAVWTPQVGWGYNIDLPDYPQIFFKCKGGTTGGCTGFWARGTFAFGGGGSFCWSGPEVVDCNSYDRDLIDCSCTPVYFEAVSTFTCTTPGGCAWGPEGSTMTVGGTITE